VRTLPLRLTSKEGESLPGYVRRYATTYGLAPGETARAMGLVAQDVHMAKATTWPLELGGEQRDRVCTATGLTVDELQGMLLGRYAGVAFDGRAPSGKKISDRLRRDAVGIWRTRFCPACLCSDPMWRLHWHLPWSVVCVKHGMLLTAHCPSCQRSVRVAVTAGFPMDVDGPERGISTCWEKSDKRRLCRAQLSEVKAPDVATDAELLSAQAHLNQVLAGETPSTIAGRAYKPLAYFRDLRCLIKVVLDHPNVLARRSDLNDSDLAANPGSRVLPSPASMAGALPMAVWLANAGDRDELVARVREAAEAQHRPNGDTLRGVEGSPGISEFLRDAIAEAKHTASYAKLASRYGFEPTKHRRPQDLDPALEARHVPQLFWREEYRRHLAPLFDFDDFSERMGQRLCSSLLLRMLRPADWDEAGRYLDFPDTFRHQALATVVGRFTVHGRVDELISGIKLAANERTNRSPLIDYRDRRRRLKDWNGIDERVWPYLERAWRPAFTKVDIPRRRHHASIWLWTELTGGHEQAAPIPLPREFHDYTIFTQRLLPRIERHLSMYGDLLLKASPEAPHAAFPEFVAECMELGRVSPRCGPRKLDQQLLQRALSFVSAHTGVDIPSVLGDVGPTQPRSPAVIQARLLIARTLKRVSGCSWPVIGHAMNEAPGRIASMDAAYRRRLKRDRVLRDELETTVGVVRSWDLQAPTPAGPEPHVVRMQRLADGIIDAARAIYGVHELRTPMRQASLVACRSATDLSWPMIGEVHGMPGVQPWNTFNVFRRAKEDKRYRDRYERLCLYARNARVSAGYANARLERGGMM
jgi:hypothetical protein